MLNKEPEQILLDILHDTTHRAVVELASSSAAEAWHPQYGLMGVARGIMRHAPQPQLIEVIQELLTLVVHRHVVGVDTIANADIVGNLKAAEHLLSCRRGEEK